MAAALYESFEVLIEIDVDGHRAGMPPEGAALLPVGTRLRIPQETT